MFEIYWRHWFLKGFFFFFFFFMPPFSSVKTFYQKYNSYFFPNSQFLFWIIKRVKCDKYRCQMHIENSSHLLKFNTLSTYFYVPMPTPPTLNHIWRPNIPINVLLVVTFINKYMFSCNMLVLICIHTAHAWAKMHAHLPSIYVNTSFPSPSLVIFVVE